MTTTTTTTTNTTTRVGCALLGPLLLFVALAFWRVLGSALPWLLASGALASVLGFGIAGILVIVWLAGVQAAAERLGRARRRLSRGLTAASWFIPIVSLVLPPIAVLDVAKGNAPVPGAHGHSSLGVRIGLWWASAGWGAGSRSGRACCGIWRSLRGWNRSPPR